jgi:hypothetical protein
MASEGVLNPKPTSLYHRFSFVAIFFPPSMQVKSGANVQVVQRTTRFRIKKNILPLKCLLYLNKNSKSQKERKKIENKDTCSAMMRRRRASSEKLSSIY